jgi:hypothetical protein
VDGASGGDAVIAAPRNTARTELKALVRRYLAAVRALGCAPNRIVRFEDVPLSAWLLDDPAPHAERRRYLLMNDGDAWCETVYGPQPASSGLQNTYSWLAAATPALAYTLDSSLDDVRGGGEGYLFARTPPGAWYTVSDRRSRPRA